MQRKARREHEEVDEAIAVSKQARAARLAAYRDPARVAAREQRRRQREEQAALKKERQWFEAIGRYTERQRLYRVEMSVAAVLKFFVEKRRNDMSAEAIATFLNRPGAPVRYSVEDIAASLEQLRADGHYEEIMAGE